MKKYLVLLLLLAECTFLSAQISEGGEPFSWAFDLPSAKLHFAKMPAVDSDALLREDEAYEHDGGAPYRFAYVHDVDISPQNSGVWQTLEHGDRLWRCGIESPGAYALTTIFRDFRLPLGAKLFLYSPDEKTWLGAFTQRNNSQSGVLATLPLKGNKLIIEYYEPQQVDFEGTFRLTNLGHDYRNVLAWEDEAKAPAAPSSFADSCFININCPEGAAWQTEKQAVCRLFFDGGATCTGSFVNNTAFDGTLYFLTAFHCISTQASAETVVFRFNYESQTCTGSSSSTDQSMSGSNLRATHSDSDFSLLELDGPVIPYTFRPYFAGWDRQDVASTSGAGIHHPNFMIKKVSVDNDASSSANYTINWNGGATTPPNTHWEVNYESGTTYGGSSGSPFFNQDHHIVGQLHGGDVCPSNDACIYGKLSYSWDHFPSSNEQLQFWLDPSGVGGNPAALDGYDIMHPGCVPNLNISTPLALSRKFEASNSIVASSDVTSGSAKGIGVLFDGGNEVRLKPGFHAHPGCFFFAVIDGCGGDLRPEQRNEQPARLGGIELEAYPNPFGDALQIKFDLPIQSNVSIRLADALGRVVAQPMLDCRIDAGAQNLSLELAALPDGIYYLNVSTNMGNWVRKVVKSGR